jgi:CRP-like cAMP-binding protein
MSPKDARALRTEAAQAAAAGTWKRALAAYLELERLEPDDPQWPKRAAEIYRKLDKPRDAVAAYDRAADRYARGGFAVQAIAVGKVILQLDPDHAKTRQRLSAMSEAPPTRGRVTPTQSVYSTLAGPGMAGLPGAPGAMASSADFDFELEPAPPVAMPRTLTPIAPFRLPPGAPLDQVPLGEVMPGARPRQRDDGSSAGIVIIPLDDDVSGVVSTDDPPALTLEDRSVPYDATSDALPALEPDVDVLTEELSLDDLVEMAELPVPRAVTAAARRALSQTPLLSGLPAAALESLIERCDLIALEPREILFREGDAGDALYVLTEGEVAVIAEGPPRIEIARLGAGAFFGEIALLTEQPRSATIEARGASEVLAIDRSAVGRLLGEYPDMLPVILRFVRGRLLERLLRTSPMFAPMPEADRAALAARFDFLEIDPGAVLVAEGSRADALYVLLAGRAEVVRDGKAVAYLRPGDLGGMTPLIDSAPAEATVRATTKCLALQLAAPVFREVIMTHPHVLEFVGDQLDKRRREITAGRSERDSSTDLHLDLL